MDTKLKSFLCLLVLLAGLTGCIPIASVDTTIDLGVDERWSVKVLAAFLEQEEAVNSTVIQDNLEQVAEGFRSQGLDAKWERDADRGPSGSVMYVLEISGQGYEPLNRIVFQQPGAISLTRVGGKKSVKIDLDRQVGLEGVGNLRYTVQGGKVITTNGRTFDDETVYWMNPTGPMEATLNEKQGINWLAYGLIVVGLVLLGIAINGLTSLPRKNISTPDITYDYPSRIPAPGMAFCEECQAEIPALAVYCPNCGKARIKPS